MKNMRFAAVLAALAVLTGYAVAQEPATKCPDADDISCSAYATLEILVTGGTCEGTAGASCEAIGTSQSKYVEAFDEWYGQDPDSLCDSGKATAAANAVATAIAEVWANAQSKVSCDGYGTACGYSVSGGASFALAMAEAVAQAAADVTVGEVADAFCYADVRAVSSAIAKATATASSAACVEDSGTLEDWQESYVAAVVDAIADAFASATASACAENPDEVTADSLCTGKGTSDVEEDIAAEIGDVCGGVLQIPQCTGPGTETCCSSSFTRTFCRCENCNGPWIKKSKAGDLKKVFEDKSKQKCFCLDTADSGSTPEEPESTPEEPESTPEEPESTPEEPESTPEEPESTPEEPGDGTETESDSGTVPDDTQSTPAGDTGTPPASEGCEGAADTSCGAFATLEILVTKGTCEGEAGASCEALSSSTSEYKQAFEEWWNEEGSACSEGKAEAAANATGLAMASVWAEASTKVSCKADDGMPQGFACGWSASGGKAWAIAFAEAVAQAAADATDPYGQADAFCYADVRAVSSAVAQAAAAAQADACTTGGTVEDYKDAVAESVAVALANAYALATAQACNRGDEVIANSECKGAATSDTETDEFSYGDACAGASQVKQCLGGSFTECCKRGNRRRVCDCSADGCDGDRWTRESDWSDTEKRSFKARNGIDVCFCLDG